jgi:multidrug efflux system membrane fusion protein
MRFGPLIALLVIAGAGYGAWRWIETKPAQQEQGGRRGGRFAPQRGAATPVAVAPVRVESVPIVREGIGNVTPQQMVTVRAQVEGPLVAVEFAEGQMVKAGDVLARIDPTIYQAQLDQALAKKTQNEANLANARLDLQRYRALAASNAGPKQQADQQAAQVAQLAALVKADEAAVANARATLGYTTITAPLDGRAGLRLVDPGNIVRPSDANGLVTIAQVTPIDATFTLPQRDLPLVSAAQAKGKVPVEVLASGGGAPMATGELAAIDNSIDAATGTIRLKATFPNAERSLWPGQFVTVRVTVDRIAEARVVPATAIRRGPEGTFVYVLDGEDHVAVRPVAVIVQHETRAALEKGVEPGEQVVTVGFARLTPGAKVTVAPDVSAPATESGAAPGGEGRRGRGRRGQGEGEAGEGGAAPGASAAGGGEGQAGPRDPNAPRGEGGRRRGDGQGRGEGQGRDEGRGGRRRQEAPAGAPAPDAATSAAPPPPISAPAPPVPAPTPQ